MTSLNEHEQQLLQTLLSHADAVSPTSDKQQQPEPNNSLDFNNTDFWDNLIINGAEAMQFEQQSSATTYGGQPGSQQLQAAPDPGPSAASGSGFQSQTSSEFNSQQPGYTGVATGQTPLAGYQDQGHGFQQVQSNQTPPAQMNVNSADSYQNQASGFQQQFPPAVGGAVDQSGQSEKPGSLARSFSGQSQGFSQQYSMDTTASGAQSDVGGSFQTQGSPYQTQTHAQFSDSSRHLQAQQQQAGQTGSGYLSNLTNSSEDQVSHSSVVYQNQTSDTPQQQSFLTEFRANNSTNSSLEALVQAAGFQQQYTSNSQTQATQERGDAGQQQPMENYAPPVANYQQQQQPPGQQQQQNMFQQGTQLNSSNTTEQTFHNSPADGSSLCFSNGLSAFPSQTGQPEQQSTIAATAAVDSPGSMQAVVGEGVQHMQFQNTTPAKGQTSQEGAETFQGQVSHFPANQSFHSSNGSPAQPVASPPSYPQPSPDPHTTYSQPPPSAGQSEQHPVGLGFTGQTCGFPKQQSFSSPAPSPDKGAMEGSVPSSPASYQHQSPAFSIQSPYSASGQPQSQGDQSTGSSYTAHTPAFTQALPAQGDQSVVSNFQGNAVYSNNAVPENPPSAGGFQTPDNLRPHCSAQSDPEVQSAGNTFQQPVFQSSPLPAAAQTNMTAQPMQEGSGPNSIEAEAVAFLVQESLKSVNQQSQSLESNNTSAVTYQQIPASQPALNTQRDQPMETQQSPYVVGSASNTGTFQTPAQPNVFPKSATQVSQVGSSFLNQALPFQAQANTFQASSSMPPQSVPLSMENLMSGGAPQNPNTEFAGTNIASSSFPCPASGGGFSNQTVYSSRPSGSVSYTQTTSSVSEEQCTPIVTESSQFSQHPSTSSNFSQFANDVTPTFGPGNVQMQVQQQVQHQQFSQAINQQQTMQQTAFTSQANSMPLVRNTSAHNLSSVVSDNIPISMFQAATSSTPASATQHAQRFTGFGNQQFEIGQLQGQQAIVSAESQQGTHNLSTVVACLQSTSMPNQLPFAQSPPAPVPVSAVSPMPQNSINTQKSPAASLQDSNQTNSALLMLSSVLQQIQSILPKAMGQPKDSNLVPMQVGTPDRTENQDMLNQLLQSKDNASQILQLLQQEKNTLSNATSSTAQQTPSQAYSFDHQEKQQANTSMTQQPNFLVQPTNQQVFIASQQQQPTQQQSKETVSNPGQQIAAQMPASLVTSLAGSLGSHGITIGSDGQLMIGNQSVKLLLDSSSGPATVNLVPVTTVASSPAPVTLSSITPSQLGGADQPVNVQNVPVNMFSASAASSASVGSMTHTISTTPTTVPNVGSNISKNTIVIPTSSFTQPLSVAGIGMGLAGTSTSSGTSAEPSAFSIPSSKLQPVTPPVQNSAGGTHSANTPPIANIFYPISSASRSEKKMDTSGSNVSATVPIGNFLNVTTGSASMLLNAFSMAVADGKQDSAGFKQGGFTVPEVPTSDGVFTEFVRPSQEAEQSDAANMEVVEVIESSSSPVNPMETDKPVTNLTPRHSSRKTSIEEELESREEGAAGSVLRRILTMKDEDGNTPNSKAGSPTPGSSPVPTPTESFVDGNTQATLIERSEKLRLSSEAQQEDEMNQMEFWTSVPSFVSAAVEEYVPTKVHRGADDQDASSKHVSLPSVEKLFDAGGATSNSAFVFTKFGSEDSGVRTFSGAAASEPVTSASTSNVTDDRMTGIVSSVKSAELLKLGHVPMASIRPNSRRQKDPLLTFQFPSKVGDYELRILAQPEEQHRARYLTEGSRGAVKDKSQQGYPHVKLVGYNEPAILQVFIGSESGRVKPHGFYQACKVCGKNSTPCNEREIDGTNVIEIEISPINDMQVYMDCVGILKLRNADVEKRIGPAKAKTKKKNSTKARLVFRCTLRKPDGGHVTLQVASTPILCTQPIGQPEISRLSQSELCVNQTNDLFIIGKNFLKGTQVFFQEIGADEKDLKWRSEAEIEVEYFQQTHLICRIPEYPNKDIKQPVLCQIVAFCGGKVSDPQDFTFKPAMVMVKAENEMDTKPSGPPRTLPFSVSPVALHLNRLVERTQHHHPSSSAMFQLPPGAVPSICVAPTLPTPPRVVSSTSTQPLPSILKPATLCLPASGQTLTLGGAAPVGDGKGPVPVQFVLPTPGMGSGAVAVDSRHLGSQPTQLVLMPTPHTSSLGGSSSSGGGGGGANNKPQPPVLTFTSMASSAPAATATTPSLVNPSLVSPPPVNSQTASKSTSAPMILFLAGPPATAVAAAAASSSTAVTNTTAVPMSLQQSISNGQVESLLKQMLESSKPSSS